jgi:ferredoxin-nitrite reductase
LITEISIGAQGVAKGKMFARRGADQFDDVNVVGAGPSFAEEAAIARDLCANIKAEDAPKTVARVLRAYLNNRADADETFAAFSRRLDVDAMRRLVDTVALA